jgi:hypothetical protein
MSAKKKRPNRLPSATMAHLNALLDEALEETFPASDPVSICLEIGTPQQTMAVQAASRPSRVPYSRPMERSLKSINNRFVG